jgi:hypothetical protein
MTKRDWKTVLLTLAICVGLATTIAAVPGIFSSVNSTNGYQVNGSAGTGGQALCSDGVYYDTPCATGTGTITAVTVTAPIVGGGASGSVNVALDSTKFVARTCNANGCYQVDNGEYHQWGVTASFDTGPSTTTLPHSMTIESVEITQCYDSSAGCSGGSTTSRSWQSGNWTASSFDVRNNGPGQARWDAWGH